MTPLAHCFSSGSDFPTLVPHTSVAQRVSTALDAIVL